MDSVSRTELAQHIGSAFTASPVVPAAAHRPCCTVYPGAFFHATTADRPARLR